MKLNSARRSALFLMLCFLFACDANIEDNKDCIYQGEVIAYNADKCGCCPGWIVVTANDTLKFERLPDNDYLWQLVNCLGFPQSISFNYTKTDDQCSDFYHKMTSVDYAIDLSAAYMPCNSSCFDSINDNQSTSLNNKWIFKGLFHHTQVHEECYPLVDNPIHITIQPDGNFSGQSSCNLYFGSLNISENAVVNVSDFGQTKMYCNGDSVWAWELKYFEQLTLSSFYEIRGDQLWLNGSNQQTMVFVSEK